MGRKNNKKNNKKNMFKVDGSLPTSFMVVKSINYSENNLIMCVPKESIIYCTEID